MEILEEFKIIQRCVRDFQMSLPINARNAFIMADAAASKMEDFYGIRPSKLPCFSFLRNCPYQTSYMGHRWENHSCHYDGLISEIKFLLQFLFTRLSTILSNKTIIYRYQGGLAWNEDVISKIIDDVIFVGGVGFSCTDIEVMKVS